MKDILYGAPRSDNPAGGVKVIYRQSELINSLGATGAVWHPGEDYYKCNWFNNNARIHFGELDPERHFVILPEIWATGYAADFMKKGIQYGIYVQNAYYTHVNLNQKNKNAIKEAYSNANIILSISKDTTNYIGNFFKIESNKIIQQRYSVNEKIFKTAEKKRQITYMPRKMEQHSNRVISILKEVIPDNWQIVAIDGMSEEQVASKLSESIIFLAFSEFEGLPVPPVEAALCGNIVIGYHGQGGKEYWKRPLFHEVNQGDIQDFIKKIINEIERIDKYGVDINEINNGIDFIRNYFSKENEINMLQNLIERVRML